MNSVALSLEEFSWLAAWVATVLAAALLTVTVIRSQPKSQLFHEGAAWASTLATLPGTALLLELLVRLGHAGWTSGPEVGISDMVMLLPAVPALFLGPILLTASFILPPGHQETDFLMVRLSHVGAWFASAVATVVGVGGW